MLYHFADADLNFTLFLLADGNAIGVRNFFLNLTSNFAGACALFRSTDSHVVGVRNFFLNLTSNLAGACALFRLADGHIVGVRNFFLNLTSDFAGASSFFCSADGHMVRVRFLSRLVFVASVFHFGLDNVWYPNLTSATAGNWSTAATGRTTTAAAGRCRAAAAAGRSAPAVRSTTGRRRIAAPTACWSTTTTWLLFPVTFVLANSTSLRHRNGLADGASAGSFFLVRNHHGVGLLNVFADSTADSACS